MASLPPLMVTALSVELGSISLATWIDAPVTSRISLIFDPPLPISDPHWDAGTMSLKVIGGLVTVFGVTRFVKSSKKNWMWRLMEKFVVCLCILVPYFFKFIADEGEGFVDGISVASDSDYTLWAGSITNVNFGSTLKKKSTKENPFYIKFSLYPAPKGNLINFHISRGGIKLPFEKKDVISISTRLDQRKSY